MRFMMLMIPRGYETAAEGEPMDKQALAKMMQFNVDLQEAGVLMSLEALHPPVSGARVQFDSGGPVVVEAPFPGVKEVLGGYWIIDVASREDAIAWASRCPAGPNEIIEVRRMQEMDEFPPDVQEAVRGFENMQTRAQ